MSLLNRQWLAAVSFGAVALVVVVVVIAVTLNNGNDDSDLPAAANTDDTSAQGTGQRLDDHTLSVSPSSVLLTALGETQTLKVSLPSGSRSTGVTWHSSDPDSITVDSDGTVRAAVAVGSAIVTASVGDRQSPPILVYIATPVDGAVLVTDDQVEDEPIDIAESTPSSQRYTLRLSGIDLPSVGDIIIGTGELPVGGRVTDASGSGQTVEVTFEVIPLDEMFTQIEIDESLDLTFAEIEIPQILFDEYEINRLPNGSFDFIPRPSSVQRLNDGYFFASQPAQAQTLYLLGPFECETTFPRLPLSLSQPVSFNVDANLSVDLLVRNQLERLVLNGKPRASVKVSPILNVEFSGKVECKLEAFEYTIPAGGPLALLFGGQVPVGVGLELEGKINLARAGFEATAEVGVDFRLGVECPNGNSCSMVNDFDPTADGTVKWIFPDPDTQFRIEPSVFAFLYAELELGSKVTKRFRFDALELKAGVSQDANLAPVSVQVADGNYASNFQLKLKGEAEAAQGLDDWLELLKLRTLKLKAEISQVLHQSPTGSAVADVGEFESGDTVNFTVDFDPANSYYAVIGYNIAEVRIYRRNGGEVQDIASSVVSDGADSVNIGWIADQDGAIGDNFYAFVLTHLLPVPDLELGTVAPGNDSTPETSPPGTQEPDSGQCRVVLRPYTENPDGSVKHHEHFSLASGVVLTATYTVTDSEKGLTFQQTVTASHLWDQVLSTRVGDLFTSSAWNVQQNITSLQGDEMVAYSDNRIQGSIAGVPLIGGMVTWTPDELSAGLHIEREVGPQNTVVRTTRYLGCDFWS